MLLKTAFKNLKKNPVMNIVCLLQLASIFLITAVMVSSLLVRYRKYLPVKDILELNGVFCEYPFISGAELPGTATGDRRGSVQTFEELRDFTGARDVFGIKCFFASHSSPSGELLLDDLPAMSILYNDAFIDRYIPKLARGRWIDPDSDELEAVIPEGLYGADVGDVIDMLFDDEQVKVKVVGVMRDGEAFLDLNQPRALIFDDPKTYRSLYDAYYTDIDDGNPPMLLSESAFRRFCPKTRTMIIAAVFDFGGTDIPLQEALKLAAQTGGYTTALESMNAASKEYIHTELMKLLPIVIVLMILTVVSAVSVSAIAARRRLRDYAKYYVLGLRWRQCALVNLFQTLITGAAALVIAAAGLAVIGATPLSETFMVIANGWTFLAIFAVFALYLAFSMIMPLIMLNTATPKELLQTE